MISNVWKGMWTEYETIEANNLLVSDDIAA